MNDVQAAAKADRLIELLITHQPALFGPQNSLSGTAAPEVIADRLTELRKQLVSKLSSQPN